MHPFPRRAFDPPNAPPSSPFPPALSQAPPLPSLPGPYPFGPENSQVFASHDTFSHDTPFIFHQIRPVANLSSHGLAPYRPPPSRYSPASFPSLNSTVFPPTVRDLPSTFDAGSPLLRLIDPPGSWQCKVPILIVQHVTAHPAWHPPIPTPPATVLRSRKRPLSDLYPDHPG